MDCVQLWTRYKEHGDTNAREELILRYAFLVRCVTDRLGIVNTPDLDRDDLLSHGIIGLIDAVEKYDHLRGPRFESYASTRIRGAILDALRGMDWLPRSVRSTASTIDRATVELEASLGRQPTTEEIAAATGLTPEEVDTARARVEAARMASLEGLTAQGTGDQSADSLMLMPVGVGTDSPWPSPQESAEQAEQRQMLIQAIGTLPPQERLVLSLYYFEELTLKEIGRVMNLTESRISQIHTKAMMRLRSHLRAEADLFVAA
ncbi:MAG: FliA/WhiG family RNA polymerase sigma factor [Armatimonadetes bacterium]|jgi:RNA polymerase sigma factor for flagellar operon FliA|nr:FliA/WhiG family RNA polymerase sigma factor [Armatimonadota bacterium]